MASIVERIFGRRSDEVKGGRDIYSVLKEIGINIEKDRTLEGRIKTVEDFYDLIMSDDLSIRPWERVNIIDKLVKLAGMAWGRGGRNRAFMEMVIHWEQLRAMYLDLCNMIHDDSLDESKRRELISVLDNEAKRSVLPAAWIIVAATFMNEDVAPKYVLAIQNMAIPVTTAPEKRVSEVSEELRKEYEAYGNG